MESAGQQSREPSPSIYDGKHNGGCRSKGHVGEADGRVQGQGGSEGRCRMRVTAGQSCLKGLKEAWGGAEKVRAPGSGPAPEVRGSQMSGLLGSSSGIWTL